MESAFNLLGTEYVAGPFSGSISAGIDNNIKIGQVLIPRTGHYLAFCVLRINPSESNGNIQAAFYWNNIFLSNDRRAAYSNHNVLISSYWFYANSANKYLDLRIGAHKSCSYTDSHLLCRLIRTESL